MIVPGDTITCRATVTGKSEKDGLGLFGLDVGMRLQTGVETCPGTATIVLPIRGGRPVPYPFVRPSSRRHLRTRRQFTPKRPAPG